MVHSGKSTQGRRKVKTSFGVFLDYCLREKVRQCDERPWVKTTFGFLLTASTSVSSYRGFLRPIELITPYVRVG